MKGNNGLFCIVGFPSDRDRCLSYGKGSWCLFSTSPGCRWKVGCFWGRIGKHIGSGVRSGFESWCSCPLIVVLFKMSLSPAFLKRLLWGSVRLCRGMLGYCWSLGYYHGSGRQRRFREGQYHSARGGLPGTSDSSSLVEGEKALTVLELVN